MLDPRQFSHLIFMAILQGRHCYPIYNEKTDGIKSLRNLFKTTLLEGGRAGS